MSSLDPAVDGFIKRILPPAKKELKYIKDEDWSEIKNIKTRKNNYDVHHVITDRNIKYAIKLYKMAGEDVEKPRVKTTLDFLIGFFNILDERYSQMVEKFDYTALNLEEEEETNKMKFEVEFQSTVLNHINSMEASLRTINFGGESDELHIEFHGKQPIPFMMSETMEKKYPDIKKFLEKKANKESK